MKCAKRKRGAFWKHPQKKFAHRQYRGTYAFSRKTGRVFGLTAKLGNGKPDHFIAFESHEAAKNAGWVKQK